MMATTVANANSLTVFNNTGCSYTISTDGGIFGVGPYMIAIFDRPRDIEDNPSAPVDFNTVKVILPGLGGIDVTSYGPYVNTSQFSANCNGNQPFSASWTWTSGGDVIINIY